MDNATWSLARMNLILHGHPTAELWPGNTLAAPHFKNQNDALKTFDFAVANPPFSAKAWSSGLNPDEDEFRRFEYGIPPAKNGDYAFLLHLIASLKSRGKGAIILPHGVLFRGNKRGRHPPNSRQARLHQRHYRIARQPFLRYRHPGLHRVIDKENAHARTGIFMIDASKGFLKDGAKNRLRAQDIHKIVDVFNQQTELPRYSRMVPVTEIAGPANDYNLNIPRYIDSSKPEDLHDLNAHFNGGIPDSDIDALDAYWKVFPSLRRTLFAGNGRAGYSDSIVETPQVRATILGHREFKSFERMIAAAFDKWRQEHEPVLKSLRAGGSPKNIIDTLAEDLLARFSGLPLLGPYDVYQRLMSYWEETMQDDVYLIAANDWQAGRTLRTAEAKEIPDLTIKRGRKISKYVGELVPASLIVARYFVHAEHACH